MRRRLAHRVYLMITMVTKKDATPSTSSNRAMGEVSAPSRATSRHEAATKNADRITSGKKMMRPVRRDTTHFVLTAEAAREPSASECTKAVPNRAEEGETNEAHRKKTRQDVRAMCAENKYAWLHMNALVFIHTVVWKSR